MNETSSPSAQENEASVTASKRRRLSRKEQKARKRKRTNDSSGKEEATLTVEPSNAASATPIDYTTTYIPTPLVNKQEDQHQSRPETTDRNEKSLGKWFPKAVTLKQPPEHVFTSSSATTPSAAILLFYQYIDPVWSDERVASVLDVLVRMGQHRNCVAGRIRIAPEGLNCTLSAIDTVNSNSTKVSTALEALHHVTMDLRRLDPAFEATDFKFIPSLTADRHFSALNIIPVRELVFYGLQDETAPLNKGGVHVSPHDFHKLLGGESLNDATAQPTETVVIDVRNHYEAALGRFDGQQVKAPSTETSTDTASNETTAAAYVDPKMRKSTDFPAWVAAHKDELAGKRVLLYCTGGIRCERASAHLQVAIPEAKEVYQLQGGIERYLQAFPDGGYWRGKNFTFDKREAISADNWNGDGGVIRKKKKASPATATLPECVCSVCQSPWDRYVGKKKCSTCGVPVLVCNACLSVKSKVATARCPLCVEQDVTVRANDVEWTDNGVQAIVRASKGDSTLNACKASATVLKWGGGHATEKKAKRKWKRTPCRFGSECVRPDCLFQHPLDQR